jgi:hypothetical protein
MAHRNHFIIRNDFLPSLILNIEPEGAFFPLDKGEEVSVIDVFKTSPSLSSLPTPTRVIRSFPSGPAMATLESNRMGSTLST